MWHLVFLVLFIVPEIYLWILCLCENNNYNLISSLVPKDTGHSDSPQKMESCTYCKKSFKNLSNHKICNIRSQALLKKQQEIYDALPKEPCDICGSMIPATHMEEHQKQDLHTNYDLCQYCQEYILKDEKFEHDLYLCKNVDDIPTRHQNMLMSAKIVDLSQTIEDLVHDVQILDDQSHRQYCYKCKNDY